MNKAAILMALADGPPIEYVASATTATAATSVGKPSGLEAGDLVLVWATCATTGATLTTASGSAWTRYETGLGGSFGYAVLFWKLLTATDVANAWTLSAAASHGAVALLYRSHGATTVTVKDDDLVSGNSNFNLTSTGFTKAAGHYGVIALALASATGTTATAPTTFTSRLRTSTPGWLFVAVDKLFEYADGASALWADMNTSGVNNVGCVLLIEVTGP